MFKQAHNQYGENKRRGHGMTRKPNNKNNKINWPF